MVLFDRLPNETFVDDEDERLAEAIHRAMQAAR